MDLVTERCYIRKFSMNDVDDLYEVLSDEEVMLYVESAFDRERTKEFIYEAGMCEMPLVYAVVWKLTGKVIGHAIFHPYEETDYEIGWILNKEYWGKGIAAEATKAVIGYAFNEAGFAKIFAHHHEDNAASGRALVKAGFSFLNKAYHEYEKPGINGNYYRYVIEK